MLQNEYLDAKIGVDRAENEPSKVWPATPPTPLGQMKREKHNDKSSKQQILRMHPLAEPGYCPQIETSKSLCRDTNIVEIPYSPTCIRM